jgi:NADPH:quinone reductase-like Zn-dependent oxidoreductase
MKAIKIVEYGTPPVFADVPTPAISDDEILVRVKCTAVNHLDIVEASGAAKAFFPIELPWTPGHEFSGLVERIGKNVGGFAVGDNVFGDSALGAYAEYVAVKPGVIVKKPAVLSFEEAASVPVAAQTAWQALFTHGHLAKGQTVLIHGAAGGVGAYAVQLASNAGATVFATASSADEAYLKSLGANQVIDYKKSKFESELHTKVDVVFDLVGGDTQTRSFAVLKEGGVLVAANQPISEAELTKHHVSGVLMSMSPSADILGKISKLLEGGAIKPDVAKVYPLGEAAEAWEDLAGRGSGGASGAKRTHGKLVLRVS